MPFPVSNELPGNGFAPAEAANSAMPASAAPAMTASNRPPRHSSYSEMGCPGDTSRVVTTRPHPPHGDFRAETKIPSRDQASFSRTPPGALANDGQTLAFPTILYGAGGPVQYVIWRVLRSSS